MMHRSSKNSYAGDVKIRRFTAVGLGTLYGLVSRIPRVFVDAAAFRGPGVARVIPRAQAGYSEVEGSMM